MGLTIDQELAEISDLALRVKTNYKTKLKTNIVTMLTELKTEIEALKTPPLYQDRDYYMDGTLDCANLIQQKIDALKEIQNNGNDN